MVEKHKTNIHENPINPEQTLNNPQANPKQTLKS